VIRAKTVEFARIHLIFCLQLAIAVPSISLDQSAKRQSHAQAIHVKTPELAPTPLIFSTLPAIVPEPISPG
jgi:hypothetical protein